MNKMLKIVVCVSSSFHPEVPLIVKLTDGRITTSVKGPQIEVVNYADRCALEEALRIKEVYGNVEVTAVMLGSAGYEWVLESCLNFELDKAVYLQLSDWEPMDSYGCSQILSSYIKEVSPDLVLCGDANGDFGSGQVSPILAECLKLPYISRAIGLKLTPGERTLEVVRKLTRGNRQKLSLPLPGVVSVDPSANQPRYISVHSRIKENRGNCVNTVPIDRQEMETKLKGAVNLVNITGIGPVRVRPKKVATPDSNMSAQDRLAFLMTGGNKKTAKGDKELVEGKVETQADKILEFLKKNLPDFSFKDK